MTCGKVAILWVELGDVIETALLKMLNPKIHSALLYHFSWLSIVQSFADFQ